MCKNCILNPMLHQIPGSVYNWGILHPYDLGNGPHRCQFDVVGISLRFHFHVLCPRQHGREYCYRKHFLQGFFYLTFWETKKMIWKQGNFLFTQVISQNSTHFLWDEISDWSSNCDLIGLCNIVRDVGFLKEISLKIGRNLVNPSVVHFSFFLHLLLISFVFPFKQQILYKKEKQEKCPTVCVDSFRALKWFVSLGNMLFI